MRSVHYFFPGAFLGLALTFLMLMPGPLGQAYSIFMLILAVTGMQAIRGADKMERETYAKIKLHNETMADMSRQHAIRMSEIKSELRLER